MSTARVNHELITDSASCRGCGYILTGLSTGDNCPECGTPVELSRATRADEMLRNADRAWAHTLLRGQRTLAAGTMLLVIGSATLGTLIAVTWMLLRGGVLSDWRTPSFVLGLIGTTVGVGGLALIVTGGWRVTTPEPGKGDQQGEAHRKSVRSMLAAAALLGLALSPTAAAFAAIGIPRGLLAGVIDTAIILAGCLLVLLTLSGSSYLGDLARRVPDAYLATRCARTAKRLAMASGLSAIAVVPSYFSVFDLNHPLDPVYYAAFACVVIASVYYALRFTLLMRRFARRLNQALNSPA